LELSVEKNCPFWGLRAVITESIKNLILKELHASHLGTVKIKMFARSYVWWPKIDKDIENMVNSRKICLISRKKPAHTPLTIWPWPNKTWSRIHFNFARPFHRSMWPIIVDAHSEWPEIMNFSLNTKAYRLVKEFKKLFWSFGLPLNCVTVGGPQFRSDDFHKFIEGNEVKHTYSPPYHLATNGAAENFVQTFKDKVEKIIKGGESVDDAVSMFLYDYRNVEHCKARSSPAFLMYIRELRTRFDLLRPNVTETVENKQRAQIIARAGQRCVKFSTGETVMMNDYGIRSNKR